MSSGARDLALLGCIAVLPSDPGSRATDFGREPAADVVALDEDERQGLRDLGLHLVEPSAALRADLTDHRLPAGVEEVLRVGRTPSGTVVLLGRRTTVEFPEPRTDEEAETALHDAGLEYLGRVGLAEAAFTGLAPATVEPLAFAAGVSRRLGEGARAWPETLFYYRQSDLEELPELLETVTVEQWQWRDREHLGADLHAEGAWRLAGEAKLTAAVIDKGYQSNHPNFQGAIRRDSGRFPSLGPDLFLSGPAALLTASQDHGTACAGLIGGRPMRSRVITGMAPDCRLLLLAVDSWTACENLARAIDHARETPSRLLVPRPGSRAQVISMSGHAISTDTPGFGVLLQALNDLEKGRRMKGLPLFWPAANSGAYDLAQDRIACHPNTFTVGRTSRGDVWGQNAKGDRLDFLAPGNTITTTTPITDNHPSGWGYKSGTSFATAMAAGVALLVLFADSQITSAGLRRLLHAACDRIPGMDPETVRDNQHGFGRLNATKAVLYAIYD